MSLPLEAPRQCKLCRSLPGGSVAAMAGVDRHEHIGK